MSSKWEDSEPSLGSKWEKNSFAPSLGSKWETNTWEEKGAAKVAAASSPATQDTDARRKKKREIEVIAIFAGCPVFCILHTLYMMIIISCNV